MGVMEEGGAMGMVVEVVVKGLKVLELWDVLPFVPSRRSSSVFSRMY